jgi:hypothetical protein
MNTPRQVVTLGVLIGAVGVAGQLWLIQFGTIASAPLRTMLSMCIAVLIGVLAGTKARENGVKVAALMGVVTGAILMMVGLGALLLDPALIGDNPFATMESFLMFTSSVMAGTVIASWLTAGVAVLVAWPLTLAAAQEEQS